MATTTMPGRETVRSGGKRVGARPRRTGVLALLAGLCACADPPAPPVPVVQGPAEPGAWAHALEFENGVVVDAIAAPDAVEPGETLRVELRARGPAEGLRARVIAWPPRAGSRQVALGGVGAPAAEVPLDPRARVLEQPLTAGASAFALPIPAPWHPPQVMVTLELLDGDRRVPAVAGPRREDGVAMLALVDVPARPPTVVAAPMPSAPVLDGRLDEPGWAAASAWPLVHSLDGEPYDDRPGRVRFGWDAAALYVAAEITDPDVWSEHARRDDPLWNQEVFELFVFGDAEREPPMRYLELQVSPRGTVFDARFERYRDGDHAWNGRWQAAVDLRGTLDDRRDRDEGWSVELSIPWAEICEHTEVSCPPAAGQSLRINAFRFERPQGEGQPAVGLALAPPRVPDFHAPEHSAVLELGGA